MMVIVVIVNVVNIMIINISFANIHRGDNKQ